VLLAAWLGGLALPILAIGLVMHAWGMRDKHALEAGAPQPAWASLLYWACWVILAGLAVYAIARIVAAS
jgi:transcription elongation factor